MEFHSVLKENWTLQRWLWRKESHTLGVHGEVGKGGLETVLGMTEASEEESAGLQRAVRLKERE